jgi:serine/threonine protein kinase
VSIDSWRIKEGSKGENFAVYRVKVRTASGLAWEMEKRYTQFRHLRRDVDRVTPGTKKLPFPEKRLLFNLSEKNLAYRSKTLSKFLTTLIERDAEGEELLAFLQVVNNVSMLEGRPQPAHFFKPLVKAGSMSDLFGEVAPTIDDFSVSRMIGQGSFGKVFLVKPRAVTESNSVEVYAMKVLEKSEVVRRHQVDHTITERRIMASASHPFIIALKFAFQTPDTLYMITEYCPGGELYFHLKRKKVFSVNMMQFYAAQIAMALEYLHHKKIIYRDLKPENILLDRDGNCKLTDFGLSKMITSAMDPDLVLAHDGGDVNGVKDKGSVAAAKKAFTFCGTPEYLSPEMLLHRMRGSGYSYGIDWWSLGVVSFEMVVGWVPFYDRDFNRMCEKILHRPLRFPSKANVPEDAQKFIKGLLQKDPRRRLCSRYHRAGELKTIPFFANSIDFDHLERGLIVPPFIPHVRSKGVQDDVSNFADEASLNKSKPQNDRVSGERKQQQQQQQQQQQHDKEEKENAAPGSGGGGVKAVADNINKCEKDDGEHRKNEGGRNVDQSLFTDFEFPAPNLMLQQHHQYQKEQVEPPPESDK